ncbi:MAG: hypothetical protein CYPHOPRED_000871 [Cyphobasidiales sp. Tagirdzhanova-0007]|nr:MAG: hypothetical protein CYPHOPRED_000871 [Cyphobasidiales sp. Tagirdzhanova-0007]
MASQTVRQHLLKISSMWPKDLIRPNHQFSEAIAKIAESQSAWSSAGASGVIASREVKDGQALIGALERLMGNRALKQYPMSEKTKKPPSMPKHYANLLEGLKKAERGETEPWWVAFLTQKRNSKNEH